MARLSSLACVVGLATFVACSSGDAVTGGPPTSAGDDGGSSIDSGIPPGLGVGSACSATAICRTGLACTMGACAPGHATPTGSSCVISDECATGDYCAPTRTCAPAGMGATGATCTSDGDCAGGERCAINGLSLECEPEGTSDVGGACTSAGDCYGGLACLAGVCAVAPPGSPTFIGTPWAGADCTDDASPPTEAYFHVPRGMNDGDFYRLPYPNDVRMKNGHPDLSNHPTPGSSLLGYDVVARYVDYVEQSADGFSASPTIFFRFNAPVDFTSLQGMGALRFVDLTGGFDLGFAWSATTGRGAYICNNSVAVRPSDGAPLVAGHTYAMLIASSVVDANRQTIKQASDLAALLAPSAPADSTLTTAYAAYAPLRTWAQTNSVAAGTILNAAVFTVGHPQTIASKLPVAVAAAAAPTATSWIRCGDAPSPCPQAAASDDRACPTTLDPAFDELHALVSLPIFQHGNEPYLTPTDGGDFVLASDGTPTFQRTEQVCMSLTVPKGAAMPAGGWPLVVFAHGTGGSFRSAITEGVSDRLASVDDGMGGTVNVAVLGIDQVEHGTRRGASTESPDDLFYNFANPAAAHGNPLQAAADQIALLRFVDGFDLAAAASPTMAEIKIGAVAFWGHSQGATAGGIALPYAAVAVGAVLSGEGAGLIEGLLGKKNPVDIADALPFVLEDMTVDVYHPVLSILQNAIDPADPLNHANGFVTAPVAGASAKQLFQPYGIGDTYAPPKTEQAFAIAAALGIAVPPAGVTPDMFSSATPISVPAGSNATVVGVPLTAIVREYQPNGFDGHFVAFQDATAEADVNHFLADALLGKVPLVGR
jgi:hypothetical protein